MPIVDFLLDNLFFVVIVLGLLSSLLAKKKGAESRENHTQNPVRTQTPSLGDRPVWSSSLEPEPEPSFIEINDAVRIEVQKKKDKLKGIKLNSPIDTEELLALTSDESKAHEASKKPVYLSLEGNSISKRAVQGMMWAEIFGPPRAKKPYRGGSYRN